MAFQSIKLNFARLRLESTHYRKLAIPLFISNVAQQASHQLDVIMSGNISSVILASVAIGTAISWPVLFGIAGLMYGLQPICSEQWGARRPEQIGVYMRQSIWIALFTMFVIALLLYVSGIPLEALGADPEVAAGARGYLRALILGLPALFLMSVLRSGIEGISIVKPITLILLVGLIINAVGNYALIGGNLGFPALGATGAGIATSITWSFACVCIYMYANRSKQFSVVKAKLSFDKPQWDLIKRLLALGVPIAITIVLEAGMWTGAVLVISSLSIEQIAANQVLMAILSLMFMLPLTLLIAASIRVNTLRGAKRMHAARISTVLVVLIAILFAVVQILIVAAFDKSLLSLYTYDKLVVLIASTMIPFLYLVHFVDAINGAIVGALRGYGNTQWPMITSFLMFITVLPVALIAVRPQFFGYELGLIGLWVCLVVGYFCLCSANLIKLFSTSSKHALLK